jgi:hypothetical protein
MAIPQPNYRESPDRGFPGQVANGETSNRISRTCEDAAGIPFGAPVWKGAGDRGCTGVVGTAETFLGFAIADHGVQPLPGGVAADIYGQYASVPIMTGGAIFVTTGGAVADQAAVTIGTGAGVADGINDVAADATHIAAPGWIFDDTLAAAGIARIAKR